jgi:hypothetical protein
MDWTTFFPDDDTAASGPVVEADMPILPEGTHVGEIKVALIQQKDFAKSDANPNGECLTVKIAVEKYRPIWESIPCNYTCKVAALCRSARVEPPTKAQPKFDEKQLAGHFVTFKSLLGVSQKTGNEFVKVQSWQPSTAPLPAAIKEAPAVKPRPAAKPAAADADDIPF